jgi:hypothetical protein
MPFVHKRHLIKQLKEKWLPYSQSTNSIVLPFDKALEMVPDLRRFGIAVDGEEFYSYSEEEKKFVRNIYFHADYIFEGNVLRWIAEKKDWVQDNITGFEKHLVSLYHVPPECRWVAPGFWTDPYWEEGPEWAPYEIHPQPLT